MLRAAGVIWRASTHALSIARRFARIVPSVLLVAMLSGLHLAAVRDYTIIHANQSLPRAVLAALGLHLNWYGSRRAICRAIGTCCGRWRSRKCLNHGFLLTRQRLVVAAPQDSWALVVATAWAPAARKPVATSDGARQQSVSVAPARSIGKCNCSCAGNDSVRPSRHLSSHRRRNLSTRLRGTTRELAGA